MIQLQSIIKPEQLFWRQVCMTSLAQIWQCGLCFSVLSEAPAKFCLMKGCTTSMLMSMPWTAKAGIAKNNRIHTNPLFSLTVLTEVWQSHWRKFLYVSLRFSTCFWQGNHLCIWRRKLAWEMWCTGWLPRHPHHPHSATQEILQQHTGNLRKFSDV